MYAALRSALFLLPPETAHACALAALQVRARLLPVAAPPVVAPVDVMGLRFPNRVGLAAGFDKDGVCIDGLGSLGFGFIEVGTVTPRAQPGNPQPRLFRLPEQRALINRMGFNNLGVDHLVARLQRRRYPGVLGINIGKNLATSLAAAAEDYLVCLERVYPHADYIVINISSPNTPGLRELQFGSYLEALLAQLTARRQQLAESWGRRVPLAVKIAPDMSAEELRLVGGILVTQGIDAVIATNTTVTRDGVAGASHATEATEAGGLSGAPLRARSTEVVRLLAAEFGARLPVIAVGGIETGADAAAKIAAGAVLVQLYTGFVYRGPGLVREAVAATGQAAASTS
ncbi:MAG: quinone-dependent dihydroorotate dehydrogenase [Porticoccaceae bacterium]